MFAPEAHAANAALGFDGSPAAQDGVARPDLKVYFTGRGACMGQVAGEVDAAARCFNPKVVLPAVEAGWQVTSREAKPEARSGPRPRCYSGSLAISPSHRRRHLEGAEGVRR
jgi:hypothetical protein